MFHLSNEFRMNAEIHEDLLPADTLFIHGNLSSNNWWRPSIELWRQQQQDHRSLQGRAILAEWRGCGKSDPPGSADELRPEFLAGDYIRLLQKLGISKVNLVGHSTGGLIALYAMMAAPELFNRAILLDPVGPNGVQFDQAGYDAFAQMSKDREFCAAILGATIHNHDPKSALFATLVDDAFNVAKEVWHGIPDALKQVKIADRLASIKSRVLVIHGELDPVLPPEGSRLIAELIEGAEYLELKGHGHSANVENPPLFVKTVDGFLFAD